MKTLSTGYGAFLALALTACFVTHKVKLPIKVTHIQVRWNHDGYSLVTH